MGNCIKKQKEIIKCYYCESLPDDKIYLVTITHNGKYGGKNICSLCYEQKIIEKYLYKLSKEILPINRN